MEHTTVDRQRARELLQRLKQFGFDEHHETSSFAARLAAEHAWSRDRVARVIHEYKRFAFLAVVTDHTVTPSDDVDQAWHLHLVYSESYWKRFCGEVLCQPLHHRPGSGSQSDRARYRAAYARTLASYRLHFGEAPPADIWPEPEKRFNAPGWVRVSTRDHWIMPKPKCWPIRALPVVRTWLRGAEPSRFTTWAQTAIAAAWLGVGACSGQIVMASDQFLTVHLALWIACLIAAGVVRYHVRRPHHAPSPLDAYELAYLAGSSPLTVDAAVAALVHRGVLALDDGDGQLRRGSVEPQVLHPVERFVYADLKLPCDQHEVARLRWAPHPALAAIATRLEQDRLVFSSRSRGQWLPALVASIPLVPYAVALMAGVRYSNWVSITPIVGALTVWVSLSMFHPTIRTAFGDRALVQWRRARADLRALLAARHLPPEDVHTVPLAVGLFGLDVVAGTELGTIGRWLASKPAVDLTCGDGCD